MEVDIMPSGAAIGVAREKSKHASGAARQLIVLLFATSALAVCSHCCLLWHCCSKLTMVLQLLNSFCFKHHILPYHLTDTLAMLTTTHLPAGGT